MDIRKLASAILTAAFLFVAYRWFQQYDWGQAFTKLICFSMLFAVAWAARESLPGGLSHTTFVRVEVAALVVALGLVFVAYGPMYLKHLGMAPRVDIGYTTNHASAMLLKEFRNPYSSDQINAHQHDLAPRFRGFHYGPFMMVGYAAGAWSPGWGYKLSSLAFLLGTLATLGAVLWSSATVRDSSRINTMLYFVLLALLGERLWLELFRQGANDIFPVFLLALAVLFLDTKRWGLAGLVIGLSFCAKFSPACFMLVALVRKQTRRELFLGFLVGCIPMAVFLIWDPRGAINNIFILHMLRFDSTSLYSITPPKLHFLFAVGQCAAVTVTIIKNLNRAPTADSVIKSFTLLLIIEELCFKEIHANHLLWFFPFVAYLAAQNRFGYLASPSAPVPSTVSPPVAAT